MNSGDLTFAQRRDWVALINSENVGPVSFFRLVQRYGSASKALAALPELSNRGGLKRQIKICPPEKAEQIIAAADDIGARWIAHCEPEYPDLLAQSDGAPPLICVKGNIELAARPCLAIVGSRNASAVGRQFTRTLAHDLGQAGFVIVSGLARGIDTNAHKASVATGTIAVVAGGVDVVYPPENGELLEQVFEHGLVISEMPPGVRPQARHFPRRNRLISGLSQGTIVVEAALRSGSLITARIASEQNREVFAVPGSPLDPRAGGTNKLIGDGATLVSCANDIIESLGGLKTLQAEQGDFFADESFEDQMVVADNLPDMDLHQQVTSLLGPSPTPINDLIRETGANPQAVHSVLLELELAGRLERHTGQRISLIGSR